MKKGLIAGALAVLSSALMVAQPLLAAPAIGNVAFNRVWTRQDWLVSQGLVDRSWTWGPAPLTETLRETYVEGVDGRRTVQYFDKSRMEINDPTADPNSQWYVTNGLLPIELMTGRQQLGNSRFEQKGPARISAIGDPGNYPTYADLLPVYQSPGTVNPNDLGRPATGFLNPDGSVTGFSEFAGDPNTVLVRGENGHGVAKVFVDFMNQRGLVSDGQTYVAQVYDPLFVFGLPVTGAYWVKAKVGGTEVPVLFQVFERRVLTYNPANPDPFKVEMGNVGQHYYQWRYGQ
ncbi:MAG TPA: hypothetical protein PKD53_01335 [Chloroflexaceae bacterium]|nr:hypothetical protein [Chloroflexaceae bacterium]